MKFPPQIWSQLKNKTRDNLISALKKDGWKPDEKRGAVQVWRHPDRRKVTIHYHSKKTYGPKLLKGLLEDTEWTEEDMRRLKLIK